MSSRQRLTFAVVAAVIAVVAIVIAVSSGGSSSGGDASATPTASSSSSSSGGAQAKPATTVVTVKNGQPAGGITKIKVNKGDQVKFTVKSDTADEIHVHGYDFHKDVAKGGSVSFSFPATIEGVFVIELENAGVQIAQLTVEP